MRAIDVDLLIQAIRNAAEQDPYALEYSQEVGRLARDAAAEYDRLYLRRQQELRAEERDRL